MKFYETLLISIGLGMDAMAVSICKGLAMKKMDWKKATIIGLYFGIFQMIMPIIGYILGSKFEKIIERKLFKSFYTYKNGAFFKCENTKRSSKPENCNIAVSDGLTILEDIVISPKAATTPTPVAFLIAYCSCAI